MMSVIAAGFILLVLMSRGLGRPLKLPRRHMHRAGDGTRRSRPAALLILRSKIWADRRWRLYPPTTRPWPVVHRYSPHPGPRSDFALHFVHADFPLALHVMDSTTPVARKRNDQASARSGGAYNRVSDAPRLHFCVAAKSSSDSPTPVGVNAQARRGRRPLQRGGSVSAATRHRVVVCAYNGEAMRKRLQWRSRERRATTTPVRVNAQARRGPQALANRI